MLLKKCLSRENWSSNRDGGEQGETKGDKVEGSKETGNTWKQSKIFRSGMLRSKADGSRAKQSGAKRIEEAGQDKTN